MSGNANNEPWTMGSAHSSANFARKKIKEIMKNSKGSTVMTNVEIRKLDSLLNKVTSTTITWENYEVEKDKVNKMIEELIVYYSEAAKSSSSSNKTGGNNWKNDSGANNNPSKPQNNTSYEEETSLIEKLYFENPLCFPDEFDPTGKSIGFTFNPEQWNSDDYKHYTNCYAYAFNLLANPLKDERFEYGGMQLGELSGGLSLLESWGLLSGKEKGNKAFLDIVKKDAEAIGYKLEEYREGMTGGTKQALVINPKEDYHWYRQDSNGGWSHKIGGYSASNHHYKIDNGDVEYLDKITEENIKENAEKIGYTVFVGFYYLSKI